MPDEEKRESGETPGAWVFMRDPDNTLPEPWRDRAVAVWLLPLTAVETSLLLHETTLRSQLSPGDAEIASLLAAGLTPSVIASRTGKSPRTIHRRLAKLRELLNTTSTAELAIILARRGF